LAVGVLYGALVVHLSYVARRTVEEDHHRVLAVIALDHLLQVMDVVGGDAPGAGGGVAGGVDHTANQFLLLVPDADDAHLWIGWPGGFEDVRIALPRMGDGAAVAHAEAAVEGHRPLQAPAKARLRAGARVVGLADGLDDGLFHPFEVL